MTRVRVGPFGPMVAFGNTGPNNTFAWPVPTKNGTSPTNRTVVWAPPRVTVSVSSAVKRGSANARVPVAGAFDTPPTPVKSTMRTSPALAGF